MILPAVVGALGVFLVGLPVLAMTETNAETSAKQRLGLGGDTPCSPSTTSPGWASGPDLPFARDELRAATIGTDVYLAGGLTELVSYDGPSPVPGVAHRVEVRSTDSFLRFDTVTGEYSELPPLPEPLNHVGLVAYRGDVYLVGGHGNLLDGAEPKSLFYRYSPAQSRWTPMPPLATPRGAAATAVIGDRLYIAGGMNAGRPLRSLEIFDFTTRTWTRGADMDAGREHVAAAVLGGQLYVLGGRNTVNDALRTVERYDPGTDRWRREPNLLVGSGGGGAVAFDGSLLAIGGNDGRRRLVIGTVARFDPRTERWARTSDMRTPRHGFGAAVVGDRVYTFGGSPCGSYGISSTVETFRPREASS